MTGMCIYKGNRGLGACAGPVSKVKVASKRTAAWKGLNDLTERLFQRRLRLGNERFHGRRENLQEISERHNAGLVRPRRVVNGRQLCFAIATRVSGRLGAASRAAFFSR
jgi:hypothetical protein